MVIHSQNNKKRADAKRNNTQKNGRSCRAPKKLLEGKKGEKETQTDDATKGFGSFADRSLQDKQEHREGISDQGGKAVEENAAHSRNGENGRKETRHRLYEGGEDVSGSRAEKKNNKTSTGAS